MPSPEPVEPVVQEGEHRKPSPIDLHNPVALAATPAIAYKRHKLLEIRNCELTKNGEPYQTIIEEPDDEWILIAAYWEDDKENEVPSWMGAYLNNGYFKQGVKVRSHSWLFGGHTFVSYVPGNL